jgi:arsenate reductase-like glutaredoxin family protein
LEVTPLQKAKGTLRQNGVDLVRVRGLKAELEAQTKVIAKARDRMRELINEYDDIWRHASEACDDLDRTIDRLSELL